MGEGGLGKVHVITGPGKGKTSAAFGLALRAAGHGYRVCIVQFMKTGSTTGEVVGAKHVKNIKIYQFGTGHFAKPGRLSEAERVCAADALEKARQLLISAKCDVLILDEVSLAAHIGLLDSAEVLNLLKSRGPGIEVVLTGRNAPAEFTRYADYVSYVDERKHPFKKGVKARKGIEW